MSHHCDSDLYSLFLRTVGGSHRSHPDNQGPQAQQTATWIPSVTLTPLGHVEWHTHSFWRSGSGCVQRPLLCLPLPQAEATFSWPEKHRWKFCSNLQELWDSERWNSALCHLALWDSELCEKHLTTERWWFIAVLSYIVSVRPAWVTQDPSSRNRGWKDGSAGKSTCCSGRGLGINSKHTHGGSHPSVTPIPGDPVSSSGPCRHQAHSGTQSKTRIQIKTQT